MNLEGNFLQFKLFFSFLKKRKKIRVVNLDSEFRIQKQKQKPCRDFTVLKLMEISGSEMIGN